MARKGIDCKLYRNTGTYASPTWDEVDVVKDFKQSFTWDKAEGVTRGKRMKRSAKTTCGLSWSGSFEKDGSADALFIQSTMLGDDVVDLLILDGDKTDNTTTGFRCDCHIFEMTEDQGTDQILFPEIMIEPGFSVNKHKAVTVASGALVYTDFAPAA